MKALIQFLAIALCVLLVAAAASAQITITSTDVGLVFSPGHSLTSKIDTATKTLNIGTLGASNWDFSSIVSNFTTSATVVAPDTTFFFSEFPSATVAEKAGGVYSYFQLATDLVMLGSGFTVPFDARLKLNPGETVYKLPMTMGTSWTSSYVETTKVASLGSTTTRAYTRDNVVDAFGNMTLPGGAIFAALRLRVDTKSGSGPSYFRTITYQYIAKNGAGVFVFPADTSQASTGVISVSNSSWNGPIVGTSVEESPGTGLPLEFGLAQNYPNPFNPSTTIPFSVDRTSLVSLKIYDVLGREVATVVSEQLSPGRYSARWDASGLPSGVYMYRLQAGSSTAVKSLLLVR